MGLGEIGWKLPKGGWAHSALSLTMLKISEEAMRDIYLYMLFIVAFVFPDQCVRH